MLKKIFLSDRRSFALEIFYSVVQSVLPLANLYVLKKIVDTLEVRWILVFGAIFLLNRLFATLEQVNYDRYAQKMMDSVSDMIHRQSVRLDLAYYDDSDFHDNLHRAQQEASFRPMRILESGVSLVGAAITIVGIVAMLATASPWIIPVMAVAVLPSFIVRIIKSRAIYAFRRERTPLDRRARYYSQLLTEDTYAKETRAFSLSERFAEAFRSIRRTIVAGVLKISRRIAVYDSICAVFETAALVGVTFLLLKNTAGGEGSIGTFVMLFEAFRRGISSLQTASRSIASLYDNKLFIRNLSEFLAFEPSIVSPANPKPFPSRIDSIEFKDIRFSYPKTENPVFDGFSLRCERGAITRIEGPNGFGKSTLLKLLLRLYDPQGGAVLVNGTDIREFDLHELRKSIGPVFQDFVTYSFTISENITLAGEEAAIDADRFRRAIGIAGLDRVGKRYKKGFDTPLGRQFGGEELSQGQKQRVAIARAVYQDAPVVAFDEPVAWVDEESRNNFFSLLDEYSRNKVVILISHLSR